MIKVIKANINLFDKIFQLFQKLINSKLSREEFRYLFTVNWCKENNYSGYVLLNNKTVVGFLGAIFSKRSLNGSTLKFCNLSTWIVEKNYRQYSILLLLPIIRTKNLIVTDLTANKHVAAILDKFHFEILDENVRVCIYFPFIPYLNISGFNISNDTDFIINRLDSKQKKIFQDHPSSICQHIIIYNNQDYCYVIFNKINRYRLNLTHIYYVSNPKVFKNHYLLVQKYFFKTNKTIFTILDNRLINNISLPFTFCYKPAVPRLYKFGDQRPMLNDNLYSELILLKQ